MRRRSNLNGLGALLLLCACSDDSFTSAPAKPSDAGNGGSQSASGGAHSTGASTGSGGTNPASGGSSGGGAGGSQGGDGGVVGVEAGVAGTPGVEAGVAEASGPTTWCYGQDVLFCEDFDRYTDINELLNAPGYNYSLVGGQFSFATDGSAPSKPNSLRMVTTAQADVKALLAYTLPAFATPPNRVRVDFTLRMNKVQNVGVLAGAAFVALLNGREVSDGGVAVAITADILAKNQFLLAFVGPATDAGATFDSLAAVGAFPVLNQWVGRYSIDIQYVSASTGRTGCADLLAGGASQLARCLALPASLSSPKEITVVMGFYSAGFFTKSGDLEVELDNVVVTAS